jgi:hypothetical protein
MQHFIAYHNTEKMGHPLPDSEHQRLLTNKLVSHLLHNIIWFVTSEGTRHPRQYCLGSVFRVTEIGPTGEDGFKRFASGLGHVFKPRILIKNMSWFPEVLRVTGNFRWGVQQVQDRTVIAGLTKFAQQVGYELIQ